MFPESGCKMAMYICPPGIGGHSGRIVLLSDKIANDFKLWVLNRIKLSGYLNIQLQLFSWIIDMLSQQYLEKYPHCTMAYIPAIIVQHLGDTAIAHCKCASISNVFARKYNNWGKVWGLSWKSACIGRKSK